MPRPSYRRFAAAGAFFAAFVACTFASAAVYHGKFDPPDYDGEFFFTISQQCLNQEDGWYANNGDNCAMSLDSVTVDVIQDDDTGYVGTLTFAPPQVSSNSVLFGAYIANHELVSFDTDWLFAVDSSPASPDAWWLQFASGHGNFCDGSCDFVSSAAFLTAESVDPQQEGPQCELQYDEGVYLCNSAGSLGTAQYTSVVRVPEPATTWLLAGGLLAAFLVRRRAGRAANR